MTERQLIERYWRAQHPRDSATLSALRHAGFEVLWPQTNERIPSDAADISIHSNYPGYPEHVMRGGEGDEDRWLPPSAALGMPTRRPIRLSGGGGIWVGEAQLTYGDGSVWFATMALETEDGRVDRETTWYAPSLPVPEWCREIGIELEWESDTAVVERSTSPGTGRSRERVVTDYFEHRAEDPAAAATAFFAAEATQEMPQYGHRIDGRSSIVEALVGQPQPASVDIRRVRATGDRCIAEVRQVVEGEVSWVVAIAEFDGTQSTRLTEYRAPEIEAPHWRSQWVEPLA